MECTERQRLADAVQKLELDVALLFIPHRVLDLGTRPLSNTCLRMSAQRVNACLV